MKLSKTHQVAIRQVLASALFLLYTMQASQAQVTAEYCGPIAIPMQYGPYDYRTDKDKLPLVEGAHFTPKVESLTHGQSTTLGGDIDYVLQRFPNHHRALVSVMRLVERKQAAEKELGRPPECYFERALRWRKDDVVARMLYAKFLADQGRKPEAISQLEIAAIYAKDFVLTHRNIGLLLLEMREFDRALVQAHKLLTLNDPDTRLRESLTRAGKWREPVLTPAPAASSADSTAMPAPAAAPASAVAN